MANNILFPGLQQAISLSREHNTASLSHHIVQAAKVFHPLIQQLGPEEAKADGDWYR